MGKVKSIFLNCIKKVNITKKNIVSVFEYILVILILLESNSVFSQIYGYHTIIRIAFVGLSIVCIASLLIITPKIKFTKSFFSFFFIDILISLMMFLNTENITGYGIIVLIFLIFLPLLYLYIETMDREMINHFLKKFVNVVFILCCFSLVIYLLSSILGIINPTGTIKILWGKPYSEIETYFNLHFNTQTIYWLTGSPIVRNTGIYTEGPMYALVILLGLIFNSLIIKSNKKNDYIKSLIFIITLITTFSVTGVICSMIAIINYLLYFFSKLNKKVRKIIALLFILVIVLMLPFGLNLLEKKLDTSSSSHRKLDIINGFNSFTENPILGKGINHEKLDELTPEKGYGYSNAIIPVLTDGGIILLIYYLLPSASFLIYSIKYKKIDYLLFFIIFCILMFTTLFHYRLTMILLLVLQYFIVKKENLNKNKVSN